MTPQPSQRQHGATLRRRISTWFGRFSTVLGVGLLVLVAVGAVAAAARHLARSASAVVTVVRMEPATWSSGKHRESGQAITYEFTVDAP